MASSRFLRPARPERRAGSAPPTPSSLTESRTTQSATSTSTRTAEALACLAALASASRPRSTRPPRPARAAARRSAPGAAQGQAIGGPASSARDQYHVRPGSPDGCRGRTRAAHPARWSARPPPGQFGVKLAEPGRHRSLGHPKAQRGRAPQEPAHGSVTGPCSRWLACQRRSRRRSTGSSQSPVAVRASQAVPAREPRHRHPG